MQSAGKRSLHSFWSGEGIPNAPYPSPTDSPNLQISFHISSWYQFIFIFKFHFWKFNFAFISHHYHNCLMSIDVLECSGISGTFREFLSTVSEIKAISVGFPSKLGVTPFKIDRNKNQNCSRDKSRIWEICKARDVISSMERGGRKPTKTSVTEFCNKSVNLSL